MLRNNFVGDDALEQDSEEHRQGRIAPSGIADGQRISDKDEEDDSFGQGDALTPSRNHLPPPKNVIKPGSEQLPAGT